MMKDLARAGATNNPASLPGNELLLGPRIFRHSPRRTPGWLKKALIVVLLLGLAHYEMRTSALQSWVLSYYARQMSYTIEPGPSLRIIFPEEGPFDVARGYTQIPGIQKKLEAQGYLVTEQARFSPELLRVARWGIAPPYREPASTGLVIHGMEGRILYDAARNDRAFQEFEDIPGLVVQSILMIENRELAEPPDSRSNPVLEWDRLAKAVLLYAGSKLGLPVRPEGASTLATQLEKYRHSARGRTDSIFSKLQQMTGASLKVYRDGRDTRAQRREIVLDYLNTVPLSAAPGYGELHGLGDGLYAWFGLHLNDVSRALAEPGTNPAKLEAYKHVLTLLCGVRAPTYYLVQNRSALDARVNHFTALLEEAGVLDSEFARQLRGTPIRFIPRAPTPPMPPLPRQKASNGIRLNLLQLLGVRDFYELNRLHLEVESTIDVGMQNEVAEIFEKLHDREYLEEHGLLQDRILLRGDPAQVVYSLMLFERTPRGNALRVHTDSLDLPFDLNEGMMLELGSTAKLRTLAHYLEVVAELHDRFVSLPPESLRQHAETASDPLTRWVAETMSKNKGMGVEALIELALDRTYSASPYESFFTGGGVHRFQNFDRKENNRIMTVREATQKSTNLVFIRIMRDLVRFHEARLSYNPSIVLTQQEDPVRARLLVEAAEDEDRQTLLKAYARFRDLTPAKIEADLLGRKAQSRRHLAMLFFAWNKPAREETEAALSEWLVSRLGDPSAGDVEDRNLVAAYGNPNLTLADYAYLLRIHPLDLWCAEKLIRNPKTSWAALWDASGEARKVSSAWLFQTRNRKAQDLRLQVRVEQDAFARMTTYWQRLGFPFERMVPSYASAIGSSGDRPVALAELMGIILNDGLRLPGLRSTSLRFAGDTPYHTVLEPVPAPGTRVMAVPVARALRQVLAEVVDHGTARRIAGTFVTPEGQRVPVGGKTGSGDNRFKSFGPGGQVLESRATNRTATFVFYVGDRYFGVLTAFVPGEGADDYRFTSALPVSILKLLAPSIAARTKPHA